VRPALALLAAAPLFFLAAEARAEPALIRGRVGARVFYAGVEVAARFAKTTPDESAVLLGVGPLVEFHFSPRWSAQVHGSYAFGFGEVYPDAWWQAGARGVWRLTPAQHVSLGLAIGQATYNPGAEEPTFFPGPNDPPPAYDPELEPVSAQLDLGIGLWEFDLDPVRFGPTARFSVSFGEGSYFVGLGLQGQYGFGVIRSDP
jgi:hypothetical protein